MLTQLLMGVWQSVGSVEVVGMRLTGSITSFVSDVSRHICVRHRTKTSMNVVLQAAT